MEPFAKRRRFTPQAGDFTHSFDDQHEYYDPDAGDGDEDGQFYDPEEEFRQQRALLDRKLKSTFETIFEKYAKDFDGVGDEIDLYTGKILVDNGHLLEMSNERDAGTSGRGLSIPRSLTEEFDEVMGSSVGEEEGDEEQEDGEEDEEEDEDEDEEDEVPSDEDMLEDDMILRGFAQARQFMHRKRSPNQGHFDTGFVDRKGPQRKDTSLPGMQKTMLPSRSDIISQFGPQLGPGIANYVSQQGVLDDGNVEPAWQTPSIAPMTPGKRPMLKSALETEVERSPSPDNSTSIWAPTESWIIRPRFRAEEDEALLEFVANCRRRGFDLTRHFTWRKLEAMVSRIL
jgi:hypothetical protein